MFTEETRRVLQTAGGDDYELCFSAAPSWREAIAAIAIDSGVPVTRIGRVVTGADVTACDRNGDTWQPPRRGFEHFTG
jgi:thiamine-monophosphate kinase